MLCPDFLILHSCRVIEWGCGSSGGSGSVYLKLVSGAEASCGVTQCAGEIAISGSFKQSIRCSCKRRQCTGVMRCLLPGRYGIAVPNAAGRGDKESKECGGWASLSCAVMHERKLEDPAAPARPES